MGGNQKKRSLDILLLAILVGAGLFLWQGRYGFSLWDEGFLWYCVQQVMRGNVPVLDFWSYDPGRYYWSGAWMTLLKNDGIMALRASGGLLLILGLWISLKIIPRPNTRGSFVFVFLAAVTMAVWMFPRHKLFDICVSIILIASLTSVITKPSFLRFFLNGLAVGLMAFVGRNHGLYGVVGTGCALVYLLLPWPLKGPVPTVIPKFAGWPIGIFFGLMPFFFMICFIPGFASALWGSILFVIEPKEMNLSLPVPWPWIVGRKALYSVSSFRSFIESVLFLMIAVFGAGGLVWIFGCKIKKKPISPVVVASVCMAFPYIHHVYRRPDISHLAQGIFPLLIGCFALVASRSVLVKNLFAVFFLGISLFVMLPIHPGWAGRFADNWEKADVGGNQLVVSSDVKNQLEMLKKLERDFAANGRQFVVVPYWPGAYAVFRRQAPLWEVFPLFPRGESFQRAEIKRLEDADPGFALVIDTPLDGVDQRCFRNTNPLIDEYIRTHFDRVEGFPAVYRVYKAR